VDPRWSPFPKDSARVVGVIRHPTATFADIIAGTASDAVDLSAYVTSCKHTSKDADVKFTYHTQLNSTNQPRPGELLELQLNGQTLWVGIIDSIANYTMTTGEHSLTVKVYSRDNTPTWKSIKRVTNLYASGTPVDQIAVDIADAVGLSPAEIAVPSTSVYVVHSNLQLANMSAWDMLTGLLLSSGYDPFIDARGVLKGISRDMARNADVVLTKDRVIAITGSKNKSPMTSVRILWLDPALSEVVHQDQALAEATITAGFFQLHQNLDIWFSQDRTQRATGTYMVTKQDANSGLLPFCDQKYVQLSPTSGQIQLTTSIFAPLLATDALAGLIASSFIPDGVATGGFIFSAGQTIPYGRLTQTAAEVAILAIMMSIGTGIYEIRGTPYDLVNARNRTEATAKGVPDWLIQNQDIENDFVMNEAHAQAFAARELIYLSRAVTAHNAQIVDDPRIEPGTIVQFYDGSRLYVTDYKRNLTHGASALLDLVGFQASLPRAASLTVPVPGSITPPGSVPPAALAVGYTTKTFGSNATLGDNWYLYNGLGTTPNVGQATQNSDGSIALGAIADGSGYGGGICTVKRVGSDWVGWAVGGADGFYIEYDAAFEPTLDPPGGVLPFPAMWADEVKFIMQTPGGTNWSGRPGIVRWIELDPVQWPRNTLSYIATAGMIDWHGPTLGAVPLVLPSNSETHMTVDNKRHKYGCLVVPATLTTQGYMKNFIDDVEVFYALGSPVVWDKHDPSNLADPVIGSTAGSAIEVAHLALIAGTDVTCPMTLYGVSVYQLSAANNLSQ
jgi:hypothetical protein